MTTLPVLDIKAFRNPDDSEAIYTNTFSQHLNRFNKTISKPHKHNFFLVVLITKGTGTHEIDFKTYDVKRGAIYLLQPGQTHYWELSPDIEGYIFFHSREFFDLYFSTIKISSFPFYSSTQNPPYLFLKEEQLGAIQNQFSGIHTEHNSANAFRFHRICNRICLLYMELSDIYLSGNFNEILQNNHYSVQVQKLEALIEEHFRDLKSPSEYANRMFMTAKHLNRITMTMLGKTTTQLITERLMLEAKQELLHSSEDISHIAATLGYNDYSYFSRIFKKYNGITPRQFRSSYQNKT